MVFHAKEVRKVRSVHLSLSETTSDHAIKAPLTVGALNIPQKLLKQKGTNKNSFLFVLGTFCVRHD
jgi:hypothetical protein